MKKTLHIIILICFTVSLSAQMSNTIRLDSVRNNEWYFVRSAITRLPDSSLIVDEQWKYFPSGKAARKYVRELYATEIAADSTRLKQLQADIDNRKKERSEILKKDKDKGGQSSGRSSTDPVDKPKTSKKQ